MRLRTTATVLLAASVAAFLSAQEQAPRADRPLRTLSTRTVIHQVAFAPDGATVLAWDADGFTRWNPSTGRVLDRQPVFAKACGGRRAPLLPRSEDGVTVAVQCAGKLFFFNMATGEARGELKVDPKRTPVVYTQSSDGRLIATVHAGSTSSVDVTDAKTGERRATIENEQEVQQLSFGLSGRILTTGAVDGVRLWQVPEGQPLRTVTGATFHALSPSGELVAVERGRDVAIVEVTTGAVRRAMPASVTQLRFSENGALLAGWNNQQLTVWDVATGKVLLTLTSSQVATGALAPDATHLAAVAMDLAGGGAQTTLGVWRIAAAE